MGLRVQTNTTHMIFLSQASARNTNQRIKLILSMRTGEKSPLLSTISNINITVAVECNGVRADWGQEILRTEYEYEYYQDTV